MPFKKGNKLGSGRPKGSENEATKKMKSVKQTVLDAFNQLQEDPKHNIVQFAKNYPKDFYQIAAKLIPTEIEAKIDDNRKNIQQLFPEELSNGQTDQ